VAEIKKKMICPDCQVDMNHHCDKVVYSTDQPQAGAIDPHLGGFIEEFHTCPKCGGGASRHA
jgi:ribosomal protein S27AE